jgi:hypothetical protein
MTQEELDAESITGDDAHTEPVETRTTPGADAHIGNDAHTEDDAHKDNAPSRTATFSTRITEEEMERLDAVRNEGESKADFLCRLFDENATLQGSIDDLVSNNEHLQKRVDDLSGELEADRQLANERVDDYAQRTEERDRRIEALELELHDKQTAIVPAGGQVTLDSFGSLGMKDIADEIHDGCAGDESCIGTVAKLQQIRIEAMSKHLDRDHDAEQKRLAREHDATQKEIDRKEKELDRDSREKQAEKERDNKLEMQLLKKGVVRKSFLEDAAFINISSVPKRPNKEIENRKRQARAGAEDEEEYDYDPEEMTDDHTE